MKRNHCFAQAILESTLFVVPLASSFLIVATQVYADTTVPPGVGPFVTSVSGNIQVLATGQINIAAANTDAITVDTSGVAISLDAANIVHNAILTTGANDNGVNIIAGGSNALVVAGQNSNITTTADGILIQDTMANINNSATIQSSNNSAIEIATGGTNATIINQQAGRLQSNGATTQPTILVQDQNVSLTNSGIIQTIAPSTQATIQLNQTTAKITNTATGQILQTNANNAINVNNQSTSIENSNIISAAQTALNLTALSQNTTISNFAGSISATGTAISVNGLGMTLINSALIQSTNGDAILFNANFNPLTNNASGTIKSVNASALDFNAPTTGDIQNAGLITSSGAALGAIHINAPVAGTITNNGGTIQTTAGANSAAILIQSSFGNIDNAGTIEAQQSSDNAIRVTVNTTGTINNTNTIQSNDQAAILLGGNITQLNNNSGSILAINPANAVIAATPAVTLSGGIINNADIINQNVVGNAIDLSTAGIINLTQNKGIIQGNILLAGGGGANAFTMTGGIVKGNVTSSGTNASTLSLEGGAITGPVTLGNIANNIVHLSGSTLQELDGGTKNDTFNLSRGSFTLLDGKGGADILNVMAPFTAGTSGNPAVIIKNVPTINIINSGTILTVEQPITDVNTAISIGGPGTEGATMTANANVTGTGALTIQNANSTLGITNNTVVNLSGIATNRGVVSILSKGVLKTGNYTQHAAAQFGMQIQSPALFGQIQATGSATLNANSTINPILNLTKFIPEGASFPIITTTAGVTDFSTLVQPSSAILSFTKSVAANNLVLTAHLNPISLFALSDVAIAVAATLESLIPPQTTNSDLINLFLQLEQQSSAQAITLALEMLAPSFNYGIIMGSHVIMNTTFDSVQIRLEDLKGFNPVTQNRGMNSGDIGDIYGNRGSVGAWAKVNGDFINQKTRNYIVGYQSEGTGFALGGDYRIGDCSVVGVALSVQKEDLHDTTPQRNTVTINSFLTTFYGWFEPVGSIFMDSMIGIATHQYDTTRNIAIGDISSAASATFHALNYGAQVDVGYAFLSSDNYYVAPFARFKYTYLDLDAYTETGAGGLDLTVKNQPVSEAIAGFGLRLALRKDFVEAIYVPEISAMYLYDFSGQAQEMQSNFLAGGNPFYITSIHPAQAIYLFGLGVNAHTSDNYTFTLKNTLEVRDHFLGYNIYAQLHYTWA